MKNLVLVLISLISINSYATRARMVALSNADHLLDVQTVYAKPFDMLRLNTDYVTFESGATGGVSSTSEAANAEGMIVRSVGDAKLGLAFGHQSSFASSWGLRSNASYFNAQGYSNLATNQQNPIEVSYAFKRNEDLWGGTLIYSTYLNSKATGATVQKENSTGFRIGTMQGKWDLTLTAVLVNMAELANGKKMTGSSTLGLAGGYEINSTLSMFGDIGISGAKFEDIGAQDGQVKLVNYKIGLINIYETESGEIFYSIAVIQEELKKETSSGVQKKFVNNLPVTIGFENDANSWLVLRGSIVQSVLLANTNDEIAAEEYVPGVNTTTLALGAGLKWSNISVDGTLKTASSQKINTSELLSQVGMTYIF